MAIHSFVSEMGGRSVAWHRCFHRLFMCLRLDLHLDDLNSDGGSVGLRCTEIDDFSRSSN